MTDAEVERERDVRIISLARVIFARIVTDDNEEEFIQSARFSLGAAEDFEIAADAWEKARGGS